MIYACQDVDFDRRERLHSIPERFGIAAALRLAQISHLLTVMLLGAVGAWFHLGWPFWVGLAAVAGLFIWEHSLVKPNDLSKLGLAFFTINGVISVVIGTLVVLVVLNRIRRRRRARRRERHLLEDALHHSLAGGRPVAALLVDGSEVRSGA